MPLVSLLGTIASQWCQKETKKPPVIRRLFYSHDDCVTPQQSNQEALSDLSSRMGLTHLHSAGSTMHMALDSARYSWAESEVTCGGYEPMVDPRFSFLQ
jgi:hypothetical protein